MIITISYWVLSFVIPIFILLVLTRGFPNFFRTGSWKHNIIILFFVLLSGILANSFLNNFGFSFPFEPKLFSLLLFLASAAISYILVNKFGLFYLISVIIQEYCLLANALLLFHLSSLTTALILIVPLYVISHLQTKDKWKIKLVITTIWGIATIVLFYFLLDFYLIMSIHLILGAFLIRKNILFTRTKK